MPYPLTLTLTLALCFAAQSLALHLSGGRTTKSESNFFSSLGRVQAGVRGEADLMVLGSSVTGRLPDRAQGFAGSVNMGIDGGSAADLIRAMDEGLLPAAPVLVVEANALQVALGDMDSEVAAAMRGRWFALGRRVPAFSAYARPAAFVYSPLLERRTGRFCGVEGEDLRDGYAPVRPPTEWAELEDRETAIALGEELSAAIRRLQERGSRVVVAWLPPARPEGYAPPAWIRRMTACSGAEWWDLGQHAADGSVRLTDGVHMDAPSAARTMRSLMRELGRF